MKTLISLVIIFIISISTISTSNASNIEHKLYKKVIITNIQIKKDYWEKVYKKIVSIFSKYRYDKDTSSLNKLKTILVKKIMKLNEKSFLTKNEQKKLNLYNNLLYRTVLLLEYNLK